MATLIVKRGRGKPIRKVQARQFGPLCVHRTIGTDDKVFSISHLREGMFILHCLSESDSIRTPYAIHAAPGLALWF
jgi:hypothetical protein